MKGAPQHAISMRKIKAIVAKTPEDLAKIMGLRAAVAKEWQVQHALPKRLDPVIQRDGDHCDIAKDDSDG
jgi:hypothetical protein